MDRPTRELMTLLLSKKLAQQSNLMVAPPKQVYQMMRTFAVQDLPLSEARALTLGRMLGVRFIYVGQVVDEGQAVRIELKVLSIKRKGSVFEDQVTIPKIALQALSEEHLFYESKVSALWRSVLLPGWGQLYQGRYHMAALYTLSSIGLLVGGIMSYQDGQEWAQLYRERVASTVPYRQRANQAFNRANLFFGGLATAWMINALDAYLSGKNQVRSRVQLQVYPQGGLQLSTSF